MPVSSPGPSGTRTPPYGGDKKIRKIGFGFKGAAKNFWGMGASRTELPNPVATPGWGLGGGIVAMSENGLFAHPPLVESILHRSAPANGPSLGESWGLEGVLCAFGQF